MARGMRKSRKKARLKISTWLKRKLGKKQKAHILKAGSKQTGTTHEKQDKYFRAIKPGKRVSKFGNVYYEYRRNRSDLHPAKRL